MTLPTRTARRSDGLIVAACEHGMDHPVYGSAHFLYMVAEERGNPCSLSVWLAHECDGCCENHEWQISTLQESVRVANGFVRSYQHRLAEMRMKYEFFKGQYIGDE